jgi:hypothetical protein
LAHEKVKPVVVEQIDAIRRLVKMTGFAKDKKGTKWLK